eukprot:CAMPEP_0185258992 /NCGR_PEP_ID=MMETSP1359-20130426/7852_1 /TAXON_ID=552665 /ORGANISM="Bigelowiella longifila, Strain CCMP242" /LENGTH=58 /DNA_ID=CAMNT_0027844735 /DNA_START=479 /DNA_END=655 /DNA_ORIENTATION=-
MAVVQRSCIEFGSGEGRVCIVRMFKGGTAVDSHFIDNARSSGSLARNEYDCFLGRLIA